MAGLNVLRLLNEPTAAGLAYNLQEKPDNTRSLFYDLGGGTFDVSILDYFDGVVQVSASAGIIISVERIFASFETLFLVTLH